MAGSLSAPSLPVVMPIASCRPARAVLWQSNRWVLLGTSSNYGESMPASNRLTDSQLSEMYRRARAARRQSRVLGDQLRAVRRDSAVILQLTRNALDAAELVQEIWLMTHPTADRLRFSAQARLEARLKSMPVIEQAKGIIMAQCGWPEDQAFDALRRASQRENIKLRDLAAKIVAKTAGSVVNEAQPDAARAASNGSEELALA